MSKSHAAARTSDKPTFAQLKELMGQIESNRVSKERLQRFLRDEDMAHALPVETVLREHLPSNVDLNQLPQDVVDFWEKRFPGFGKVMTGRLLPLVREDFTFPAPAAYAEGNRMRDELSIIHWQRRGSSGRGLSTRYSGRDDFLRDFGGGSKLVLIEYGAALQYHVDQELERVDYLLRMIVGMEVKARLERACNEFWDFDRFSHLNDALIHGIDPNKELDEEDHIVIVNNLQGSTYACLAGTFLPESNEHDGSWGLLQMWTSGVYPVGCRDSSLLFISSD